MDNELLLINNLRNRVNNILVSDADNFEIQPEWGNNVTELVENINNSDPRRFLQWDVIRKTMFVADTSYIVKELKFLIEGNWHIWKSAIEEVQIGYPDPCISYPKSSGNLIHHAYHLAQLGNQLEFNITDIDCVLEFGGGYGSMCRLFHNLGFEGKYIIFDLPVFSALQEFYLKSIGINAKYGANEYTNGVSCIFKIEMLREILSNKESKKKSIFIATWSISETPIYLRNAFLSMIENFDLFLIVYQTQFGEIDNSKYFSAWKDSLRNYKWYSHEIRHLPNNYYLFGKNIPHLKFKSTMENAQKPTISACMIVKNEEALLPTCLNSIKNAVDEIIIVDTGSTDNTVAIARSFGARVYYHKWNDSFSEARNHSLGYASGDWILQIDADEELEQADIPTLRQAINNAHYNGVVIAIISTINDNLHKFYNTRVFRRGKAAYQDIIHEQIIVEGERLPTEIRLYHHGYNLDKEKMRRKWELTTCLLKKQLSQDKHNGFAWFNLIRNFRTQELFHDGIKAGEEALKLIIPENNVRHYTMIMYETANCCLHANDPAKTRELCNAALSTLSKRGHTPENIDIVFTLACAHLKEGAHRMAIDCFGRYLSLREWYLKNMHTASLMIDTLGYDYAAHNGIGYCFEQLGQTQTAISHLQRAIALNPKDITAYKNLSICYRNLKNYTDAVNVLLKTIPEDIADNDVLLKVGELYIIQEAYEKAIPFLEAFLKRRPDDKGALLIIAQCYERLGHVEAAMLGYKAALESH